MRATVAAEPDRAVCVSWNDKSKTLICEKVVEVAVPSRAIHHH
jgi:hypothetical protein